MKVNSPYNVNFKARFSPTVKKRLQTIGVKILKENGLSSKEFDNFEKNVNTLKKYFTDSLIDTMEKDEKTPYLTFVLKIPNKKRAKSICYTKDNTDFLASSFENMFRKFQKPKKCAENVANFLVENLLK